MKDMYVLRLYAYQRIPATAAHPSFPPMHTYVIEADTDLDYLTSRAASIAAGTDSRLRKPVAGFAVQVINRDTSEIVASY